MGLDVYRIAPISHIQGELHNVTAAQFITPIDLAAPSGAALIDAVRDRHGPALLHASSNLLIKIHDASFFAR